MIARNLVLSTTKSPQSTSFNQKSGKRFEEKKGNYLIQKLWQYLELEIIKHLLKKVKPITSCRIISLSTQNHFAPKKETK